MEPVSPILPGIDRPEFILAANQPEYIPLPAIVVDAPSRPMVTRWRLSEHERLMITNGADIVLQQLTFGSRFQPVNLQTVMPDDLPELMS